MSPSPRSPAPNGPLNPRRLDVAALADMAQRSGGPEAGSLQGRVPLADLQRLQGPDEPCAQPDEQAAWQARAHWRPVRGGAPELWLHLSVQAVVSRTCQRCLQPVALDLQAQRNFLFAATEELAEAWDAERDDADVLALTRSLNLLDLVEDELLLALPLVPRHESCPEPLPAPLQSAASADEAPAAERPNPFAVLAQLKRGG